MTIALQFWPNDALAADRPDDDSGDFPISVVEPFSYEATLWPQVVQLPLGSAAAGQDGHQSKPDAAPGLKRAQPIERIKRRSDLHAAIYVVSNDIDHADLGSRFTKLCFELIIRRLTSAVACATRLFDLRTHQIEPSTGAVTTGAAHFSLRGGFSCISFSKIEMRCLRQRGTAI